MKINTIVTNLWRHPVVPCFLGFLVIAVNAYAAGESAFVTSDGLGTRPAGMGEAFTAVADDINAMQYNPAGCSFLIQPEFSAIYLTGLMDSYYGFVGVVYPFKKSAVGLSLTTFDGGKMDINMLNPDGSFKESKTLSCQQDTVFMLSYSLAAGSALSLGCNLKMIQSTLAQDYGADAQVVDLGLLIRPVNDRLCLGVTAKNIRMLAKDYRYYSQIS